jgi:hypothetical protein
MGTCRWVGQRAHAATHPGTTWGCCSTRLTYRCVDTGSTTRGCQGVSSVCVEGGSVVTVIHVCGGGGGSTCQTYRWVGGWGSVLTDARRFGGSAKHIHQPEKDHPDDSSTRTS